MKWIGFLSPILSFSLIVASYAPNALAETQENGSSTPVHPLFADTTPLKLTLAYDIHSLRQNKFTLRDKGLPGRLTFEAQQLDVVVSPRGAGSFFCPQPQLRINFAKSASQNTPFAGLKKVKLFTSGICLKGNSDPTEDKMILANYLIYKLAEKALPYHFKTRLAEISYVDTSGQIAPYTQLAFFLEPEKQVERRLGLKRTEESELKQLGVAQLSKLAHIESVSAVNAFEFFIGNFDYGVPGFYFHITNSVEPFEKNVHMYRDSQGQLFPLVFDFDFSRLNYTGGCGVGAKFKPSSVQQTVWSCDVNGLTKVYKSDLEDFKFKEDAVRFFPSLKQAFLQWRQDNKSEIDQLGPEHSTNLDTFIEAFERALLAMAPH